MAWYVVPSFLNTVHYREKIILISKCHEKNRVETHSYREDNNQMALNVHRPIGSPTSLRENSTRPKGQCCPARILAWIFKKKTTPAISGYEIGGACST